MVPLPEDWNWTSYVWLDTDWLLGQFGKQRSKARQAYRAFVKAGKGVPFPLLAIRHQLILGDDPFVAHHRDNKARP